MSGRIHTGRAARLAKVNVGSGIWFRRGWATVDYYAPRRSVDFSIDLRSASSLPFASRSVSLIFSSHLLEHLSDAQGVLLLEEFARVLRPGGLLRVSLPDAERAIAAYRLSNTDFFSSGGVLCSGPTLEHQLVNFFASYRDEAGDHGPSVDPNEVEASVQRPLGEFIAWCVARIPSSAAYVAHVNGFDFEKLERMLRSAGFTHVKRCDFRRSSVNELRGTRFDNRPRVSLYVEASL